MIWKELRLRNKKLILLYMKGFFIWLSKFFEYCNLVDWIIIILISVYESFLLKKKLNNEIVGLVFK